MQIALIANSQNRINYSQYMHNHLVFNPAYNEHSVDIGANVLYRNQWTGFQGAPKTQIGNVFYNLNRHSFALQFSNDAITAFKSTEIAVNYNISFKANQNTTFSFGLKAAYQINSNTVGQEVFFDAGDNALSTNFTYTNLNYGTGFFVRSEKYFFGIGLPYLIKNDNHAVSGNVSGFKYNHLFLTGGLMLVESESLQFFPTILAKTVSGAPLQIGLDLNAIFQEKIWASVGYRNDHSAILSAGYIFPYNIKAVYSYDLGFSVNRFGGSTHEISIGFGMSLFNNNFSRRQRLKKSMFFKNSTGARY